MPSPEINALMQRITHLEGKLAALEQVIKVSGGSLAITVGGNMTITVGAGLTASCGQHFNLTSGQNLAMAAGMACNLTAGATWKATAGTGAVLYGRKDVLVQGDDKLELKSGDASLVMKKNGAVDLDGKDITLDASGTLTSKASRDVVMKGSKIGAN